MSLYLRRPIVYSSVPGAFYRVRDPHCTIMYSMTLDPDIPLSTIPMIVQVVGARVFKPPHKEYHAGAYLLDDHMDNLNSRHEWLLEMGAISNFPFIPHATYHYALPGETVAAPLPEKFWVVLGPEIASELPIKWLPEATTADKAAYERLQKDGFYPDE